ncbi:MAG: hypothetical protein GTO18_01770 [Anaerolineales bacterium]|nr:hypothetical protein [Anaerolineales bacterium]
MPITETEAIKRDLPPEWNGVIPSNVFLEEARHIVAEGEKRDIILRAMGGVGIRLHTVEFQETAQRLGRLGSDSPQEFTDLDFMAYRKQRPRMNEVFDALGYGWRRPTLSTATSERRIYFHPKGWFFVDVFFDELRVANHPLNFKNRIELDSPTITLADLLLEKLQIVNMGNKDVVDTLILLLAHKVGESDAQETINAVYIAKLLAKDWGFWYTVTTNLKGIKDISSEMSALTKDECASIDSQVDILLRYIATQPKTIKWRLRSKIGTKQRWYEPVETTETVGDFGIWRLREPPQNSE